MVVVFTFVYVYPVPVFDYGQSDVVETWMVEVHFGGGGSIRTQHKNSVSPGVDAGNVLVPLRFADEAIDVGRRIATRNGSRGFVWVRKFRSYARFVRRLF